MSYVDYIEYEEDSDNETWLNDEKSSVWDYYKSMINNLQENIKKLQKENIELRKYIKSIPSRINPIVESQQSCQIM